jgi:type II secretory pathway pseudopilin PulG
LRELIAVLALIAISAAFAIPRYIELDISATSKAIDVGISELNARQAMILSDI